MCERRGAHRILSAVCAQRERHELRREPRALELHSHRWAHELLECYIIFRLTASLTDCPINSMTQYFKCVNGVQDVAMTYTVSKNCSCTNITKTYKKVACGMHSPTTISPASLMVRFTILIIVNFIMQRSTFQTSAQCLHDSLLAAALTTSANLLTQRIFACLMRALRWNRAQ